MVLNYRDATQTPSSRLLEYHLEVCPKFYLKCMSMSPNNSRRRFNLAEWNVDPLGLIINRSRFLLSSPLSGYTYQWFFIHLVKHSIEYKNPLIYWGQGNVMANIFKISLLLIVFAFEDANGRPPRKGIKEGKFIYSQPSVSKKRYLLNTTQIYFVCQSEVYLSQGDKYWLYASAEERFHWEHTILYA